MTTLDHARQQPSEARRRYRSQAGQNMATQGPAIRAPFHQTGVL